MIYRHSALLTLIKHMLDQADVGAKTFNVYSSKDGASMAIYDEIMNANYVLSFHVVKSEAEVKPLTVEELLQKGGL